MRNHLLFVLALALSNVGCAGSSRNVAEGLYPTTLATEQGAAINAMVEHWYDNARAHPSCRARQNYFYADEGRGPRGVGEQEFFAQLRSPVIIVISGAQFLEERVEAWDDGYGEIVPREYHKLYRFGRARILYAEDSDYVRIWPAEFQLSELAEASRIPNDFVTASRSYLVFANLIEFQPNLDALVVCDLSDPTTLARIFGQPPQ